MEKARKKLVIALDDLDFDSALELIKLTKPYAQTFKIGLSLFIAHGPKIIEAIKALEVDIFLDLKLCDIPMQVEKAVENALAFEPKFLTLHALGGASMLKAAANVAKGSSTTLLCVTILTSIDNQSFAELGFRDSLLDEVLRLSRLVFDAGIHGFVSSPHEVAYLRREFKKDCFLMAPGVRPLGAFKDDQSRIMTPTMAIKAGVDAVVVGRPITKALNSALMAKNINQELTLAIGSRSY